MAWLHTGSGLVIGWLLFVMFVTGSCGYYRHEITAWMTPELQPLSRSTTPDAVAAQRAADWLSVHAAGARQWTINLPDERSAALRVEWREAGRSGPAKQQALDPRNGQPLAVTPRETRGGDFLYRLHFDLHFMSPILGRVIVGLAAVTLLVALFSGVVTHRRIFQDLFRFRPGRGRRTWLDLHNLTGVLALPFHVVITWTGLVTLMILLMPWGVLSVYARDGLGGFIRDSFVEQAGPKGAAGPALLMPLGPIVLAASRHWDGDRVGEIAVSRPGDLNARVEVTHAIRGVLSMRKPGLVFNGATGEQTSAVNEDLSAIGLLHSRTFGLHLGHFAGPVTRAVLFLLGLSGAAMIGSGMILWSAKRAARHAKTGKAGPGARIVDGLNLGVMGGLPIAIGAYLWTNQLLPAGAVERASIEVSAFFWSWMASIGLCLALPHKRLWSVQLGLGGGLLVLAPLLGLLGGGTILPDGPARSVSLILWLVGGGLLSAATVRSLHAKYT